MLYLFLSLVHGVCGDPADFCISTRGAGAGGLALAVEGPSKAEIGCQDNKDGTVNVSYLPTAPGEYKVSAKFADEHIEGSPFTCKVTGEGKKRNAISVGASSDLTLPTTSPSTTSARSPPTSSRPAARRSPAT